MPTDTRSRDAMPLPKGQGMRALAVLERDGRQWCATFYRLVPEGAVRAPEDIRGSWGVVRDTVRCVLEPHTSSAPWDEHDAGDAGPSASA